MGREILSSLSGTQAPAWQLVLGSGLGQHQDSEPQVEEVRGTLVGSSK